MQGKEGSLQVKIIAGRGLAIKDQTGASDPYVVVGVAEDNGLSFDKKQQQFKTPTIRQNLNPNWRGQVFDIHPFVDGKLRPIRIEVWDQDQVTADEFMGHIIINSQDYTANVEKEVNKWLELKPRPGKKEIISGDLNIAYTFKQTAKGGLSSSSAPSISSKAPVASSSVLSSSSASKAPSSPKPTLGIAPTTSSSHSKNPPQLRSSLSSPDITAKKSESPVPDLKKSSSATDIKKQAALTEEAWRGVGIVPGLKIWRIENFKVQAVAEYGKFYSGDSYIILHTYQKVPGAKALAWNIHFWLGSKTTQDEAGTAAYKTVELDDYLGGMAVQYREVEGHESQLFLSHFEQPIVILEGGVDSGFKTVQPEKYVARLLQFKGKKNVRVMQVPMTYRSLNSGDVFVLDAGLTIYQWNGTLAAGKEKMKAAQFCRTLVDERKALPKITVYNESDKEISAEFWLAMGGKGKIASADAGGDDDAFEKNMAGNKRLFKLSDESGKMQFTQIAVGKAIKRRMLETDDVFIYDTGVEVYAWIGLKASLDERRRALQYAQDYLTKFNRPAYLPVIRILEGAENRMFESAFETL